MTTGERDDAVDIDGQTAEPMPQREMMSLLAGSTSSVLPATGDADALASTASTSTPQADDLPLPSSNADGSASQETIESDDDVSASVHQSDTASSQT